MRVDLLIEQRLRDGGVVHLAVAVPAIADHVNHNVSAKTVAVFGSNTGHANDRLGIFSIHVKDWNALALGQVRGKARSMQLAWIRGEANHVVDEHVNASTNGKAFQSGKVQRLRPDALSGKRSVTMQDDGQDFLYAIFSTMYLLGSRASQRHRIDGLQVAGIGNQMHADRLAAADCVFSGRAVVILHVPAAEHAARINILKSGKDILRRHAHNQRHYRQASTMAHGQDRGVRAQVSASFQHGIEQRNLRGRALARIALGPEITGLKNLLKKIGLQQTLGQPAPVNGLRRLVLHLVLYPLAPLALGQMHELGANSPAINAPRFFCYRPWYANLGETPGNRAAKGIEVGVHVPPSAEQIKYTFALQGLQLRCL